MVDELVGWGIISGKLVEMSMRMSVGHFTQLVEYREYFALLVPSHGRLERRNLVAHTTGLEASAGPEFHVIDT